jgi:thioredoxin-like negative regulator of GroEL
MARYIVPALVLLLLTYAGPTRANPSHADAPGIDWFDGDVAHAFESAQATQKPVFLYWGAKWCPPCQQLKSSVFSRNDFIAKSKQFVTVYLDGDDAGAQKWGEKFRVSGYPTVVILRPDQQEITRIAGGMDLSLYADLLDGALSDLKPMANVLAAMQAGSVLAHGDCQRLAYYAWDLRDYSPAERKSLAAGLSLAARSCGSANSVESARLTVASAALDAAPEMVTQVIAIVENPSVAAHVADALQGLDSGFYGAVRARGTAISGAFLRAWTETMESVANDPAVIDADQLAAVGARLALVKAFAPDKKVPDSIGAGARARVASTLAKRFDPYVRAGVVNSASHIYDQLDDIDAEYAMLNAELTTARAPYYYMVDLGDIEEKRGHAAAALSWYERAYRESQGIATRFQWGAAYLSALLRLAPTDHARIRDTGMAVLAELDGPDRIQARSRAGLEKLDQRLRKWNARHRYDADIKALHVRMSATCGRLPSSDAGRGSCRKFLS